MPKYTHPVPILVPVAREQFLRRDEGRLRSVALLAEKSDPVIKTHLDIVLMAEDLTDVHEAAADRFHRTGNAAFSDAHKRFAQQAVQIRLHHLDQLSKILVQQPTPQPA
jgi:hypothetical protein